MSRSAEIKLISANGMREVIADTKAAFKASGHNLNVTVVETGEIRRRVLAGEPYDVIIVPESVMDAFVTAAKVVAGSAVPTVRINFGLAVRADAPRPDASTPEALKRALIAANTVLITDPATGGISGVHFMAVLDRLGIADAMKGKLVLNPGGGIHAARVVKREADLAVQAEHEIRSVPDAVFIDYPKEFQNSIIFMAGIGTASANSEAAKTYLAFLKGPEIAAAIKAHHLSPA